MKRLNSDEIINLLENLIGGVRACGETYTDEKIMNNLLTLIDIADWCIEEVKFSSETRNRNEKSMHEVGWRARQALAEWCDLLDEMFEATE